MAAAFAAAGGLMMRGRGGRGGGPAHQAEAGGPRGGKPKRKRDFVKERAARLVRQETRPVIEARWAGVLLAASDRYEVIDGKVLFPQASVHTEWLEKSDRTRHHNPIGTAEYYNVRITDSHTGQSKLNRNAAWSYPTAKREWAPIQHCFVFWKGVVLQASIPSHDPP